MQLFGMVFATAWGVALAVTSVLIRLARRINFYSRPNERSVHRQPVPAVGGLGFVTGAFLSFIVWGRASAGGVVQVGAPLVLIVLLGWWDDWQRLSAGQKLAGQLLVAIALIGWAGVSIRHLEGILGIGALAEVPAILLSVIGIVGIINAFNLIDGIDGLAGLLGLWACSIFGYWLYNIGEVDLALLATAVCGGVCAFLYFNLAPARVFMGDAGSMFIGALVAVLALTWVAGNRQLSAEHPGHVSAGPALAIAVLFVPLFDALRVFALRLMEGRSPFRADRKHVHHLLLARGLGHRQICALLVGVNVAVTGLVWQLQHWGNTVLLLLEVAIAGLASFALEQHYGNRFRSSAA